MGPLSRLSRRFGNVIDCADLYNEAIYQHIATNFTLICCKNYIVTNEENVTTLKRNLFLFTDVWTKNSYNLKAKGQNRVPKLLVFISWFIMKQFLGKRSIFLSWIDIFFSYLVFKSYCCFVYFFRDSTVFCICPKKTSWNHLK